MSGEPTSTNAYVIESLYAERDKCFPIGGEGSYAAGRVSGIEFAIKLLVTANKDRDVCGTTDLADYLKQARDERAQMPDWYKITRGLNPDGTVAEVKS